MIHSYTLLVRYVKSPQPDLHSYVKDISFIRDPQLLIPTNYWVYFIITKSLSKGASCYFFCLLLGEILNAHN